MLDVEDIFNFAEDIIASPEDISSPVEWIEENFIDPISKKLLVLEPYQRRIIRRALSMNEDGSSRYDLVVWSQPKKSGKTAIAGAVGCWVAENVEPPNEICCVANDQEQSRGRIYAAMLPTLKELGWHGTDTNSPGCSDINGTSVKAITTRYEKEAGSNQGISLWSELWAYRGERLTRLWEEMTPPPTRKFRMRWVETYAGFRHESKLLRTLYLRIFKDDTEKRLQPGVRKVWHDLPVYESAKAKLLVFWDHKHRMSWQTPDYYSSQRSDLRPSSYARLHGNAWVDSSEQLITEDVWGNSIRDPAVIDKYYRRGGLTFAIDGSKNGDCTALVGSVADKDLRVVVTPYVKVWEPEDGKEIDQESLIKEIKKLYDQGKIRPPLYYDPYQLVKLAQDLRKIGISCQEYPQGVQRIKSDTFWFKMYKEGYIWNVDSDILRDHVLACQSKDHGDDRIRIIKLTIRDDERKELEVREDSEEDIDVNVHVDAGVAQSMSTYKAYTRSTGGWAFSGRPERK